MRKEKGNQSTKEQVNDSLAKTCKVDL